MKIDMKHSNGKWTVNGKTYDDLNPKEKKFMDDFFREVKIKRNQPVVGRPVDPDIEKYGIYSLR